MSSNKKRGLGRGLDALLSTPAASLEQGQLPQTTPAGALKMLAIERLRPGRYQPRRHMDEAGLQELADSIRQQGIMQPVVVRSAADGRYEIIAGERRWRAAQLAGLEQVPVLVREAEDRDVMALALIENLQREDLNPLEEAMALQSLQQNYQLTQQELADAVGKSRSSVANQLRLLNLQREVLSLLEQKLLEMGHARALLSLPPEQQTLFARQLVAAGWSVRQTEEKVRKYLQSADAQKPLPKQQNPDIQRLEARLQEKLGAAVKIHHAAGGKGRLEIRYTSLDELDGILRHFQS